MISKRNLIRWFIKEVQWATPRNVAYFIEGKYDDKIKSAYSSELSEMLKVKDSSQRLKRIKNQDGKYAYTMHAKTLPTFLFNHDVCLRDVIGKFLHDNDPYRVSFEKPTDAVIGQFHFELDNGHMNEAQLEEKIRLHYATANVQVVFIMRHREKPELENQRLQMIFGLSDRILHDQPNKILAACYTQYLRDGMIYNRKGPAKIIIRNMNKQGPAR